jgi:hypothetical protein
MMASSYSDIRNIINLAICWNSLVLINTLKGKNLINYTQSADDLSLNSLKDNKQSVSETLRKTAFKFFKFQAYFNTLFKNVNPISND